MIIGNMWSLNNVVYSATIFENFSLSSNVALFVTAEAKCNHDYNVRYALCATL